MTTYRGVIRVEGTHREIDALETSNSGDLLPSTVLGGAQGGTRVTSGQGEPALEEGAGVSQSL